MWHRQIILILCILCVRDSLEKALRPRKIDYEYRLESRGHSPNKRNMVVTTPRPLLQQYWKSFVRNLPAISPLSWNISSPIGQLLNMRASENIKTPVAMHYMAEMPNKRKTKTSNQKTSEKSKTHRDPQSRNYYNTYDNSYNYRYQQEQMRLQPLGLDHNGVMHFYESSTGQYYALQLESQPYYYNNPYKNQYMGQYINHYNQFNRYHERGFHNDGNGGLSNKEEEYYPNSEDSYDADHEYNHEHKEYDFKHNDYDNEYEPSDQDNMEYDDSVELVNNWDYDSEEIFTDRKLKRKQNNFDNIAKGIFKIQKQLLQPETEEDVQLLLSQGQNLNNKKEIALNSKKELENPEVESVRNAFNTFTHTNNDAVNRKRPGANTKNVLRLVEKPKRNRNYYIFPKSFWL